MGGGGGCYEMQVKDDHVGLSRAPCTKIYTQPQEHIIMVANFAHGGRRGKESV